MNTAFAFHLRVPAFAFLAIIASSSLDAIPNLLWAQEVLSPVQAIGDKPAKQVEPGQRDEPEQTNAPENKGDKEQTANSERLLESEQKPTPMLADFADLFRQIFFFQSQAAELLPPTFRPIDLTELTDRLNTRARNQADGSLSPVDNPQLLRGVYVARVEKDRLVSDRSHWDIAYRGRSKARLIVGKLGLALRVNNGEVASTATGQVVSDLKGNTSVVVDEDTRVTFGWSSAGRTIDRGTSFDLTIPASIQTRFLIEVPRNMEVQAIDGVGRSLPSPPPEAGVSSIVTTATNATAWYSIDAGGLTRVRLRLINRQRGESESILPVRQASIQYDLTPQAIRFVTRMLVDSRSDTLLPIMSIDEGHVTSIRIGGTSVPWSEVTIAEGTGLRIDASRLEASSASGTMNITIEGESAWNAGGGSQSLPWPRWQGCRPILIATEMQAQIRLDASLHALRFELPSRWRFIPAATGEDGSRLFRCVGTLGSDGPAVLVRPDEKQSPAESVLRLSATNTQFQAQFDTSILMNESGPQPVQIRVDRGWNADLVTIPSSGRVIDLPSDPAARRNISIWPTSDEVVGRRLQIRIAGSMPIRSVAGRIEFPATSFVTIQNSRNRVAAIVMPPAGFNWTGDVALRTTRIHASQLSTVQKSMIGDASEDGLLLELNEGRLPPLVSRRPDMNLDTTSRLVLNRDGERLIETVLIACDSASTDIQNIVVDLGSPSGRPPMQWSAIRADGSNRRIETLTRIRAEDLVMRETNASDSPAQSVPSVTVAPSTGATTSFTDTTSTSNAAESTASEVWRLELGNRGERQVMLLGRREYPFKNSKQLPLPMVPGASSQSSQVVVMPTLAVKQASGSVLRMPPVSMTKTSLQQFGSIPAETDPIPGAIMLRYEATEKPTIEVASADKPDNATVVWRESVRIVASNRGGDTIVASYDIDPGMPLEISHDVNLRLVSVTNSAGVPLAYEALPHQLNIRESPTDSRILITWTRTVFSNTIVRRWVAPRMSVNAIVLRRDWQVMSAPDTVIPTSLFFGRPTTASTASTASTATKGETEPPLDLWTQPGLELNQVAQNGLSQEKLNQARANAIDINPETSHVWLFDSALAYPTAAMLGLCMFALNWWLATRRPFIAMTLWVFSIAVPVLLFSSNLLWISSVCVPLAAGGLIAVSLSPNAGGRRNSARSSVTKQPSHSSDLRRSRGESRSSLGSMVASREGTSTWSGRAPNWMLVLAAHSIAVLLSSDTIAQTEARLVAPPLTNAGTPASGEITTDRKMIGNAPPPLLLIPTTADGEIAGSKVYIPQSFYFDLFRDGLPGVESIRITTASYRLRLEGLAESKTTAELEARFQLEDNVQRTEAVLPFRPSQIKSVQWLTESESRPIRWSADGDAAVRLTLPASSNASLLIRIGVDVQITSRLARRVQFSVPPIAGATLLVDTGTALQRIDIANTLGEVDAQPEAGRLNASLGAVNDVDVALTYRDASRSIATIAQRRYWIHAGYDRTNLECEVDLNDSAIRNGSEVPLIMLEGQLPLVTSSDWAITAIESLSTARQQLTLQAQRDNPGPVRLLWEVDSLVSTTSTAEDATPIVIPEILSIGPFLSSPPTSIGLDAAQGLRLVPKQIQFPAIGNSLPGTRTPSETSATATLAAEVVAAANRTQRSAGEGVSGLLQSLTTSPEVIDTFVSSWKGYRGAATEVLTATSPLPRLVITSPSPRAWEADEVHHLHVRPGELQLSYSATITPGDRLVGPLRVVLPVGSELRVLTMNNVSIDTIPRRVGNRDEVALPDPIGTDPIRLRVVLHMRVSQTGKFNPPRISVEPIQVTKGTYTLSRDQSLMVKEIVSGGFVETENRPMGTDEQLVGGWVPCWTWRIDQMQTQGSDDPSRRPQLPGVFRVEPRDITIESQQRNSLVWNQTRWSFETLLRLKSVAASTGLETTGQDSIDFVNIELPTTWCENLIIEPDMSWSRQPAMDPATQIVRIRPGPITGTDRLITIRIRGQRNADADTRIEVPSVRVLGPGKRDVYLTVPEKLDGRTLDWEASAAIVSRLPTELINGPLSRDRMLDGIKRIARPKDELAFRAVAGNASVRLSPSRYEATEPRATIADVQWFATESQRGVMFCRWDISPGRDESIIVKLPKAAKLAGVWIDEQQVNWETSQGKVKVDLPLSRLAQSVEFVCEVEHRSMNQTSLIPVIENVPVDETWLTIYEAADDLFAVKASVSVPVDWIKSNEGDRTLALATSIRSATESSLRRVTEGSQDQIVRWIASWDQRFRELTAQATTITNDTEATPNGSITSSLPNIGWDEQVRKWRQYVRRVAGESTKIENAKPSRWMAAPHWRIVSISKHTGEVSSSPSIRVSERSTTLAVVIQMVLTLTISAGLCLLLWHGRSWVIPIATHPATWLFATGLSSLAVAPVPVAIAICGVAITAPILNYLQSPGPRRL